MSSLALAKWELARDQRWQHDRYNAERLHARACVFRHFVHLLPEETILEIGAGSGRFTEALWAMSRNENHISAVRFEHPTENRELPDADIEWVETEDFLNQMEGKRFEYVVMNEMGTRESIEELLHMMQEALKPGGIFLFFISREWNPEHLERLISERGFVNARAERHDFLPRSGPRWWMYFLSQLSVILENTPGIRRRATSIWIAGQMPPLERQRKAVNLATIPMLKNAVSIVVPCFNEEMNIKPLIVGLKQHYDDYIREFVLVNDNSKDKTQEVMEELRKHEPRIKIIKRSPPGGVGRALKEGIAAATSPYILTMDSDFTMLLPELRDLFEAVGLHGADIVYGSRFNRESILLDYPLPKILSNRMFHFLARHFLHRGLHDVTNNLKLMKREVAENLKLEEPHFAVNAEIGLQPVLMGYTFAEVPISWINRTPEMGISSFKLAKVGRGYIRVLLRMMWKTVFGLRKLT